MSVRVLVMGGTRFIGRSFVAAALAAGHDVTLFHRGTGSCDLFENARHIHADRDESLELLRDSWDVTVDFSVAFPRHVRELAIELGPRAGAYVMISTTAAYAGPQAYGFTEDQPLQSLTERPEIKVTDETYGALKALCEGVAREMFTRHVILRPTYVIGPGDYTGRFAYWLRRIARGGTVLAPGPANALFQVIDVRDLTEWMVAVLERLPEGAVHLAAPFPPITFGEVLNLATQAVGGCGTNFVWVDREFLIEQGCTGDDFPLWPGANKDGIIEAADPALARRLGFVARPLAVSIRDVQADLVGRAAQPQSHRPKVGLDLRAEAKLLRKWEATAGTL